MTVNRADKNLSRIGPKYSGMALSQLSFTDILDICLFDTQNAFFEKKYQILKQVFGIAQGSPPSPSISVSVLMYSESRFLTSIRDDQRFTRFQNIKILGIQYIDDLRIVIVCLAIPEEIAKSTELIELFIKSLPDSLLLEPEENYNNTFRFLEGFQFYNDPTIKSAFVAKNYDLNESTIET